MDLKDTAPVRNGQIKRFDSRPEQGYRAGYGRPMGSAVQQQQSASQVAPQRQVQRAELSPEQQKKFRQLLEDLVGTRGAYVLDAQMNILGKVPSTELQATLRSLKGVEAIVFDGSITKDLVLLAEKSGVLSLVAMDSKVRSQDTKVHILTPQSFVA